GLIAPDHKTFDYIKGKPFAPKGEYWEKAVEYWRGLPSDAGAKYDQTVVINAAELEPYVTWGTSPEMSVKVTEAIPELSNARDENQRKSYERAYSYMGIEPAQRIDGINIDKAFIGSCTNSRIEDLREAARVAKGYSVNGKVNAMVVPGSMR